MREDIRSWNRIELREEQAWELGVRGENLPLTVSAVATEAREGGRDGGCEVAVAVAKARFFSSPLPITSIINHST